VQHSDGPPTAEPYHRKGRIDPQLNINIINVLRTLRLAGWDGTKRDAVTLSVAIPLKQVIIPVSRG
jgi:hypothetical protein